MPSKQGRVPKAIVGRSLVAAMLVMALAVSSVAAAPSVPSGSGAGGTDAPREPKVVIIVGPTGQLTNGFRAEAEAAARVARRYTSDVTTIYSPNATWAAVKPALQGASLVIYMGHGNGWPSPYRDSLYRPSQNGLGLNPVAGGNDHTHRYYGEKYLASDVRLATGAIVLLHHLCYAAGNSEPGLPEGPHAVAKQRVENYAAGWLAAGARAVVAEAYFAPAYYVRHALRGERTIEDIWASSPTYKGNVDAWASRRTDRATAFIDHTDGGRYGRSLVVVGSKVRLPAGSASDDAELPDDLVDGEFPPSAPLAGTIFGPVSTTGAMVSWSSVELKLPYQLAEGASLPEGVMIGAQWQPLELDGGPTSPANVAAETLGLEGDTTVEEVVGDAQLALAELGPSRREGSDADEEADADEADAEAADVAADAEEVDGLRQPLPAEVKRSSLRVPLLTPELPGLYELSVTLHDADGALLQPDGEPLEAQQFYVARPLSVAYSVPVDLTATSGEPASLTLTIANDGAVTWEQVRVELLDEFGPRPFQALMPEPGVLVGYAVRTPADGTALEFPEVPLFAYAARVLPGEETELQLAFDTPRPAGEYLLILDIETPSLGSLSANGVRPAVVRLTVSPAPSPLPEPAER